MASVFMPEAAELLAACMARIKTLIDAAERASLKNEALRDTFLKLKQEVEAYVVARAGDIDHDTYEDT